MIFRVKNMMHPPVGQAYGFTLIEMMIGMAMGLLLLAGLTSMFVSMSNVSRAITSRSDRMGDIYLASQIMQTALRESKKICWDATKNRIIYQPLDSPSPLNTTACSTVDNLNGSFELRPAKKPSHPTPYICWNRPQKKNCHELIRDMDASKGLFALLSNGVWTIALKSSYFNENKKTKKLSLRFKVWPRNWQ